MPEEEGVHDRVWGGSLPPSAVACSGKVSLFVGLGVALRAAFVRNDRVAGLPDAPVLCARHGFEGVAIDKDPQQRVPGLVHDVAPSNEQTVVLGHAKLALDCRPKLACRKAGCCISMGAARSSWFEYFQSAEARKAIRRGVVSCKLFLRSV